MLATLEVQKAIYEKLIGYGLEVFNSLPINTPLPYVQLSGVRVRESRYKLLTSQTYTVSLTAWCIDTTSINIHTMCDTVLQLVEEDLDLGDKYAHDSTRLEFMNFLQEEYNTELLNRCDIELEIQVSEI